MIVRERPSALAVLFALRGSILPRIAGPLTCIFVVSVLVVPLHHTHPHLLLGLSISPFTLIGLSLSIFMSFRNTACFNRWWEGRILWGQIIIACRSFARQVASLPLEQRRPLLEGLSCFATCLAQRLRGDVDHSSEVTRPISEDLLSAPNPADAALTKVGIACTSLFQSGSIDSIHHLMLEKQLSALSIAQGGCERIKNTPLPFAYSLLLHRTAYIFCTILPFALVKTLDWWTPFPTLIISYTFFGLDALGDELSDPFGFDQNDLPLNAIARTIEREMLHAAGHAELPPELQPQHHVLM